MLLLRRLLLPPLGLNAQAAAPRVPSLASPRLCLHHRAFSPRSRGSRSRRCTGWDTGSCHDDGANCNQCRSNAPHIFNLTWCADTTGFAGLSCSLDLGYRSAGGAHAGVFQYSVRGRAARDADYTSAGSAVTPVAPWPFASFGNLGEKNNILTVYTLTLDTDNRAGENLALTASAGFCCRAIFSGGTTTTGTLYIGNLEARYARTVAPPLPAAAAAAGYSPGAVTGIAFLSVGLGAVSVVGGLAALRARRAGRSFLSSARSLLGLGAGSGGGAYHESLPLSQTFTSTAAR